MAAATEGGGGEGGGGGGGGGAPGTTEAKMLARILQFVKEESATVTETIRVYAERTRNPDATTTAVIAGTGCTNYLKCIGPYVVARSHAFVLRLTSAFKDLDYTPTPSRAERQMRRVREYQTVNGQTVNWSVNATRAALQAAATAATAGGTARPGDTGSGVVNELSAASVVDAPTTKAQEPEVAPPHDEGRHEMDWLMAGVAEAAPTPAGVVGYRSMNSLGQMGAPLTDADMAREARAAAARAAVVFHGNASTNAAGAQDRTKIRR